MSEKEKLNIYYVASRPSGRIQTETLRLERALCEELMCRYNGYYEDSDFGGGDICPDDAKRDGWRIRPVKLVFLDEKAE